ncbi:MAG TPA: PBP1A family penicillin-binding protein [bacterium]|nr:PBP1A family penicillin-binding protein [bacterium]
MSPSDRRRPAQRGRQTRRRSPASAPYRPRRRVRTTLVVLAGLLFFAMMAVGISAGVAVAVARREVPDITRLYARPSQTTRIYAATGELVASLYRENRVTVGLGGVPPHVRRAVIAVEDARFYEHRGVDLVGTTRAVWHNVRAGRVIEGGSTITQQLARLLFLTPERVLSRKLTEMAIALEIERRLTKNEILERYLNEIYFGQGAYGIEMASRIYFGKRARQLSLPEGAMLAGIIRAPSLYTPFRNFAAARARQEVVLDRMVTLGMITPAQAAEAMRVRLTLNPSPGAGLVGMRAPYFVSYILPQLLERFGEEQVYRGGLEIITTLDPQLQALAEKVVRQGVARGLASRLRTSQAALVAIDPRTGHVRAMIGGVDFAESQFNRAWQAQRQPGSAFKPFIYTTALADGVPPTRILQDTPITFTFPGTKPYKPKNYDGRFRGPITLRRAVEQSINIPAVKMLNELGTDRVVEMAQRMGIASPLHPHLSLALGTADVTPLEMASAYGTLANMGVRVRPIALLKVTDASGKVLYEASSERVAALSPEVAYLMTDILKGVIARGTGRAAGLGRPAAGKTGTTDDYRNAWFIGYTPQLSTAVWVGNDDNAPMRRVVGGGLPAQIWAAFMKPALAKTEKLDWTRPDGIVARKSEIFIRGSEPPPEPEPTPGIALPGAAPGAPPGGLPAAVAAPAVSIDSPADGVAVQTPVVVSGTAIPGATVRIVIVADSGLVTVTLVESYVPADPAGRFAYEFRPPAPIPGMKYIISVTAIGAQGTSATRTITITEAGP